MTTPQAGTAVDAEEARDDVTCDAFLGGRLMLSQPRRGHRAGHDALLLAAATPAQAGDRVVDLGAGVGAAGLALATRVPNLTVTLIERAMPLVALADDNIRRNGVANARAVTLDVTAPAARFADAGLPPDCADGVLMNPPFNDARRQQSSPDADRRDAHSADDDTLPAWLATARRLLRPGGCVALIWRADDLDRVLAALRHGFGGIALTPVFAAPGKPALRLIAVAQKGSRAPLALYEGLVLADAMGRPSAAAQRLLREGAALSGG